MLLAHTHGRLGGKKKSKKGVNMKRKFRIIGVAVGLAIVTVIAFSGVALAADPNGVYTEWNFDEGEINIHTEKTGGSQNNIDNLNINVDGGTSSGFQDVSSFDYGCHGRNFELHREVTFDNGTVTTFTQRDNTAWPAYTEYYVEFTTGEGSGFLGQDYHNEVYGDNMNTYMSADCEYDIHAGEATYNPWPFSVYSGYWDRPIDPDDVTGVPVTEFGMGAIGDGSAVLSSNFSHRPSHGDYLLGPTGDFHIYADPVEGAGFSIDAENYLDLGGFIETSDLTTDAGVYWPDGGHLAQGASGAWVIINGFIHGSD